MGFTSTSLDLIRRVFRRDQMVVGASPEVVDRMDFASRGMTAMMSHAYGPLSGGVDTYMHDTVSLNHDLVSRYEDYEAMNEFPEIACLHGDSPVFTLEQGWVRIAELVGKEDFHVLAYDFERKSLVPAAGTALMSAPEGHHKPMVRVTLDNGEQITCTADHPFLTKDGRWVEAGSLPAEQQLMAKATADRSVMRTDCLEIRPAVYDLHVPKFHNFLCNGVVVHNTAWDLFADDATVADVLDGKALWYEAPDDVVQDILNSMLEKQLRADESLWDYTRGLCQYGNNFVEIIALDKQGVVDLKPMYVPATRRIQDQEGILYGYVHDPALGFSITTTEFFDRIKIKDVESPTKMPQPQIDHVRVFEPWEVVHFRMHGANVSDIYGISIADAARYAWKRLMMMEDAMVVFKLTRSPQRYAFYCDVGDVPPAQAKRLLNQMKNDFKKQKVVDGSGKVQFKYNPLSSDEDFFLAVRKDKRTTEVEVLSSPEGQWTEDVNYFKDKMIASLKVPKSYLAGDDTVGRANLAQLDVRMARSVMRIQRVMKNGYNQVARVDLSAKNIDPDMVEFRAMMNIPSGVLEMAQVEVQNAKLDLAKRYQEAGFSQYYIYSRVLGLSDDEIQVIKEQNAAEKGATDGQAESIKRVISMDIDHGAKAAKNMDRYAAQIKEDMDKGRTEFGSRMRELRLLMQEVKHSMSTKRGVRWNPEGKR